MKYLLLTGLILVASFAQAKQATSDFGYTIEIPETWAPLTGPEAKANPDLFNFDNVDSLPPAILDQVIPLITSGQMDFYFLPDNSNEFADNINVIKQLAQVPSSPEQVKQVCEMYPIELKNLFNRDIAIKTCEKRTVSGRDALYIESEGAIVGTTSMMYQIEVSTNILLMFTATVKNTSINGVEADIHKAINTVNIN